MSSNKIHLILNTIKYLKFKQVYYRGYYTISKKIVKKSYKVASNKTHLELNWENGFSNNTSFQGNHAFVFLNIPHTFKEIDWNYAGFGKLWTYNLNYFDFLHQNDMSLVEGLGLIKDFMRKRDQLKDGLEPYSISLRGMNWVKFLSVHKYREKEIDNFLFQDYHRLLDQIEYHILGNHLLENGFSLLFGAYYFGDSSFFDKAKEILSGELLEQSLPDGAHFELSPMYHKIILFRLLDCIQLMQSNTVFNDADLLGSLENKAQVMLGFLRNISFSDNTIPLFNDAAFDISPSNQEIYDYALKLGIRENNMPLKESGYRKIQNENFEIILDVGQIGPDYQPGHAHADTFSFCLYIDQVPVIVDMGTSTYNIGKRRDLERSTLSHNTVAYGAMDSSEVWGGFRVADRAKVRIMQDDKELIMAEHDGYRKMGITHQRKFSLSSNRFLIEDVINGKVTKSSISSLHFHPDVKLLHKGNHILINKNLKVSWEGFSEVSIKAYKYAPQFNILKDAMKWEGVFEREGSITIEKL